MGLIREPDGVDFYINSKPLTKEEENALSEYISSYKAKMATKRQSHTINTCINENKDSLAMA